MKSLIKESCRLLYRKNVPQVQNSIKIIKSQCFSKKFKPKDIKKFKQMIKMRSIHYPVQYLCHHWPFRLLDLKLKEPILIPRFQSQYMIQVLIQKIKQKYKPQQINEIRFVEYGCGSGALGLSLIKQLKIKGTLIDINQKCISLTCMNSKLNHIDRQYFSLLCGDMNLNLNLMQNHEIVISNPPYLSEEHYQKKIKPQIKKYQDKLALVADHQGMFYIEKLLTFWKQHSKQGIIILQFDGRKLEGNLQWAQKHVIKDQYGKRRFILIEK